MRKSQANHARRLRPQKGTPGRVAPPWRRLQTSFEQHLPHRGRGHRDAQALELADDTSVSPMRVLAAEPQDQGAYRRFERRPTGRPLRVRPAASDQLTMPAQQRRRLDREARPGGPRQCTAQRCQQPPIGPRQLRLPSLPTQHRELMAQRQNLKLLRATRPPQQPNEREQVPHREIHERPKQAALPRPRQQEHRT